MVEYINKYRNLALNTTPLSTNNIELAQQAAIELYKVLDLTPPTKFDIIDSPEQAIKHVQYFVQLRKHFDEQLYIQLYNELCNQFFYYIWNRFYAQLVDELYNQFFLLHLEPTFCSTRCSTL